MPSPTAAAAGSPPRNQRRTWQITSSMSPPSPSPYASLTERTRVKLGAVEERVLVQTHRPQVYGASGAFDQQWVVLGKRARAAAAARVSLSRLSRGCVGETGLRARPNGQ